MTLDQIRFVLEVAQTGSINQAAKNLFISQSALSLSLQNLEKELGKPLFIRTNRGVTITPFGHMFVDYVLPIKIQINQLESIIHQEGNNSIESLSVANDGFRFVSDICATFFNENKDKGVRIEHHESDGNGAVNMVANNIADIGVIRLWSCYRKFDRKQLEARGILFHSLFTTDISIQIGKGNPLYDLDTDYLTVDMLEGYTMITYNFLDLGPFSDLLDKIKIPFSKNSLVTSSRAFIYEMLEKTDAYYLSSDLDQLYTKKSLYPNTRSFKLKNCPIKSEFGWIQKKESTLSSLAVKFTKELESRFSKVATMNLY